jgi:hypothetical protein
VRSSEPVPPSRLQPKVPRDLETVCLKCLHKEPARRYATAEEFAEDLRRFQHGEPIRARRVGSIERVLKWVRRRPAVAALEAALVLAGVILVVGALHSYITISSSYIAIRKALRDKDAENQRAEFNLQQARKSVDRMLTRLAMDQLAEVPHMEPVRRADARPLARSFSDRSSLAPLAPYRSCPPRGDASFRARLVKYSVSRS